MRQDNTQYRHQLAKSRGEIIKTGLPGLSRPVPMDRDLNIPVDEIAPSPHQTRRDINLDNPDITELAENINKVGLINPIVVRPNPDPKTNKQYKWILVAGERRLAAFKRLGRKTIKASIRENLKEDEVKAWSVTLCENVMRRQLRPDEAGEAIELAKSMNMTNNEIANQIGVSERWVLKLHGAAKLPADLREKLDEHGKLTRRHIEAFNKIIGTQKITEINHKDEDTEEIRKTKTLLLQLLDEIINHDLTGETAIERAKELIEPRNKSKSFLTSVNKKLNEAIKRKPSKMSEEKRRLVINQAKQMIETLSKLVQEESKKLHESAKS